MNSILLNIKRTFCFLFLITDNACLAQQGVRFMEWDQDFVVPQGITTVTIEVVGRGGNGGAYGGGGGGGGGFAKGSYTVVPGATLSPRFSQDTVAVYPFLYATAGAQGKGGYQNPPGAGGSGGKAFGGNITNAFGGNGGSGNPSTNGGGGGGAGGINGNGNNGNNAPVSIPSPTFSGALGGQGGGGISGNGGKGSASPSDYSNYYGSYYGGGGGGGTDWFGGSGGIGYCKISWGCDVPPPPLVHNVVGTSYFPYTCGGYPAVIGARGYDTLLWYTDTTLTPFAQGPSVKTASLTYSQNPYKFYVRSSGCGNSGPLSLVLVHMMPTPTVQASASLQELCYGQSCFLNADGAFNYLWSHGFYGYHVPFTHTLTSPAQSQVTLSVVGIYEDGVCADTTEVVVLLHGKPPLQCVASKTTCCTGEKIALQVIGPAFTSYTWSNGAHTSTASITADAVPNFSVAVTDSNSCVAETTIQIQNVTPKVQIFAEKENICLGDSTTLTALGAASYTWNNGHTINPMSVIPQGTAVYSVSGSAFGCVATATISVEATNCTGLQNHVLSNDWIVYPNPCAGKLTVTMGEKSDIKITGLDGSLLRSFPTEKGNQNIELDLPPGVYFLSSATYLETKIIVIADEH